MRVDTTDLAGVLLFTPAPHRDERGFFTRTSDAEVLRSAGIDPDGFVQDSLSRSVAGVVRGMHLRTGAGESKLIRCSYGEIFDVVIDLRPDSPTYRRWAAFHLTGLLQQSLYVPSGCAHGFQALTDPADITYRIDRTHDAAEDLTFAHDDPDFAIPWPLPVGMMSEKDRSAPRLRVITLDPG